MAPRLDAEIRSQPDLWELMGARARRLEALLPRHGRLMVIGCGTSFYVARACAALWESSGRGEADAFPASEAPVARPYQAVVAISRSGTTTEVLRALESLPAAVRKIAISAVSGSRVVAAADEAMEIPEADEQAIVQTRFPTTTLCLMRALAGHDVGAIVHDGRAALMGALPLDPNRFDRFVFLGRNWTVGICEEAALKLREAARAWAEAYPAMEFRHGPISACDERSAVWTMGHADAALNRDVEATGATVRVGNLDPIAELVLAQRIAELAQRRGLDPDNPPYLTRSVTLDQEG
jgi:glucosamine--fructose-6-phosphate aminotransferase (isomerizing)